jgi:dipeptidyl-peptidase-4
MLSQQGWVVISVDNRGTPAPRGREWRKCVYGRIGVISSRDQAAAATGLMREHDWIDPERIAIWGWSGGGSMSLNAIFRQPEIYGTAVSVAPVPDQRLYDTIYQERYMGLPDQNPDGYREGSPITYAKQLEGDLLLIHGTADDNVHIQGSELLVNELIRHGKRFTYMAYPGRSHGLHEGQGTTRHLYDLMTEYLRAHSPPGPR